MTCVEWLVHPWRGGGLPEMRLRKGGAFAYPGRVVIITGGSRGLGLLMARQLKKEGARLALLARNRDELMHAKEELDGGSVLTITCDVGERTQVQQAIDIVIQHFGRIDMLVNNAGIIHVGPLEHMTYSDYHQAMNVHFWGALHCTEAVLPHMRRRQSGRIVNIASIARARRGAASRAVLRKQIRPGRLLQCGSRGSREGRYLRHDCVPGLDAHGVGRQRAGERPPRSRVRMVRRPQLAAARVDRCAAGGAKNRRPRRVAGLPHLTITPQARLAAIAGRLMPNGVCAE